MIVIQISDSDLTKIKNLQISNSLPIFSSENVRDKWYFSILVVVQFFVRTCKSFSTFDQEISAYLCRNSFALEIRKKILLFGFEIKFVQVKKIH